MYLEVTVKAQKPVTFRLSRPLITVGSLQNNDIVISESSISKNHLKIFYHEEKWFVVDLGSTNGSFLDHQQLLQGDVKELKTFSDIRMGDDVYIRLMDLPFHARVTDLHERILEEICEIINEDATRVLSLEEFEAAQLKAAEKKQARREAVQRPLMNKTRSFGLNLVMTLSFILIMAFILDRTWRSNGNLARDNFLQLPKGDPLWRGPGGQIQVDGKSGEE